MPNDFLQHMFGLEGQTAVVIGGTGVLGGALCDGLAAAGAHVIVAGRSQERGEERVKAIQAAGGSGEFIAVDATSRASLEGLLKQARERRGAVDMLINCAGVNAGGKYEEITDDDFNRIVQGNLTATHIATQIFAPAMARQDRGGSILNIGSVTAHTPLSRVYAYSAAKAGVINLTKNTAREYASQGVRINALCPGFFPAEQNRAILDAERVENIMRNTPMNRFGEPEELVGAALLLLSRAAGSFIAGAVLYVDGGFTAMRF